MLGIPFLGDYITNVVKVQKVADWLDHLHYYLTSLVLACAALAISAKQYFGSPIQCWTPAEFAEAWEQYAEDLCFIASSYHIPLHDDIPKAHMRDTDGVSYYRWVPIVLALQAVAFSLPNWLWNIVHRNTVINPELFISEAGKMRALWGEERDREIASLSGRIRETLSELKTSSSVFSGSRASLSYLGVKCLYLLNACANFYALNHFLGGHWWNWAYQTTLGESPSAHVFPTVILCDFSVRSMGAVNPYTLQCVLMLNMINEKLFLFLHGWFWILMMLSLVNLVYYCLLFFIPAMRNDAVRAMGGERACPDALLLLSFVERECGARLARRIGDGVGGAKRARLASALSATTIEEVMPSAPEDDSHGSMKRRLQD